VHETVQQLTFENKSVMEMIEKNTKEGDFIRKEAQRLEEEHQELLKNNVLIFYLILFFRKF